jgi:hypothetical protein
MPPGLTLAALAAGDANAADAVLLAPATDEIVGVISS